MKHILSALILLGIFSCHQQEPEVYLFSFFQDNGQDGLHLATSTDGLNWKALNNNQSFLTPTVGDDKLMRDPCIIQGHDQTFHMVWTVSWNERGIGYASSTDLIHWSEQKYIPVMHHEPKAQNCWAPELFYDEIADHYIICWATTIPGRFPNTDSLGDDGYNHRIYFTTTKDFVAFTETKLLYDQGFNVIDATIQKNQDAYIMFLKDETLRPKPEKNIRIAFSDHLTKNWSLPSTPLTPNWVEGPTAIRTNDNWIVYFDMYTKHKMGAIQSSDLQKWTNISDSIHFPEGTRHGTIFTVKKSILDNIIAQKSKH